MVTLAWFCIICLILVVLLLACEVETSHPMFRIVNWSGSMALVVLAIWVVSVS